MHSSNDPSIDPKGLIRESYRIEGISDAECRSILIDWALSLPDATATPDALRALLARHASDAPDDHPMTALLQAGLDAPSPQRRSRTRRR